MKTPRCWRKALKVTRTNNQGSQRLIHAAADLGAEAVSEREGTSEEREAKRQLAMEMNLPVPEAGVSR